MIKFAAKEVDSQVSVFPSSLPFSSIPLSQSHSIMLVTLLPQK